MVNIMGYILGIVIFLLDIWAIIGTLQSSASGGAKFAWVVGILIFPLIGWVAWYITGPKGRAVFI